MVFHQTIELKSEARPTFHDVTNEVTLAVTRSGVREGVALVFSQHTTCSVFIQEQSDDVDYYGTQLVLQDMVNGLARMYPTCATNGQYGHPGSIHIELAARRGEEAWWSLNTDAHLRSVLLGRSESVPIMGGELTLGDFGRIYFADFDQTRARNRTLRVQIIGE